MKHSEKKTEVLFSINYIKDSSFFVKESLLASNEKKEILVQMTGTTAYSVTENIVKLTLKAWYHYRDEQEELASIEVDNLFTVVDLKNYINENNKLDFPSGVWASIVGLSISHTRALFTKHLAATSLQKVMIPIMNPFDVAKQYFPESFKEEQPVVEKKSRTKKSKQ